MNANETCITPEYLRQEQKRTLSTAQVDFSHLSKLLFASMDLIYGQKTTFSKMKVLELIARCPYQAWEFRHYSKISRRYQSLTSAQDIFDDVKSVREQQDNEQWHLLFLEEIIQKKGIRQNYLLYRIIPQILLR